MIPFTPPAYSPTGVFDRLTSVEDVTAQFLKDKYLTGLTFVDDNDVEYPDTWYDQKIAVAASRFEHYTNLTVTPTEVKGEAHDYYIKDYEHFAYLQLYRYPVIVTETSPVVKAVYPTGQVVTTFPTEWVRLDPAHGQIQLVPTQGSLSQVILGQGGSYLPIIYQGLGYLPQLFQVDYTAGFSKGTLPQIFIDTISKLACIELMSVISDTVHPVGVTNQSFSIDGMSESRGFQNTGEVSAAFGGRISQYKKELFGNPQLGTQGLLNEIKSYYTGVNFWVSA